MKITTNRIKEIIREEYRRMNEAEAPLKYRAGSPFTYTPVEKGSKEEQRAMDLAANTTGDYDLTVLGVREASAGEIEILVRKSDGEKDVVTIQKRQIKTEPDEDPKIEKGRLNRPMGVKLKEVTEPLSRDAQKVVDDIEDTAPFIDLPDEFTGLVSHIAKEVAPQVDNARKAKYFEELARSLRKLNTAKEEVPTEI
jgi:hypothetical protein